MGHRLNPKPRSERIVCDKLGEAGQQISRISGFEGEFVESRRKLLENSTGSRGEHGLACRHRLRNGSSERLGTSARLNDDVQ
jgi:hypothetical protein